LGLTGRGDFGPPRHVAQPAHERGDDVAGAGPRAREGADDIGHLTGGGDGQGWGEPTANEVQARAHAAWLNTL
jgi:hypothetical protein